MRAMERDSSAIYKFNKFPTAEYDCISKCSSFNSWKPHYCYYKTPSQNMSQSHKSTQLYPRLEEIILVHVHMCVQLLSVKQKASRTCHHLPSNMPWHDSIPPLKNSWKTQMLLTCKCLPICPNIRLNFLNIGLEVYCLAPYWQSWLKKMFDELNYPCVSNFLS